MSTTQVATPQVSEDQHQQASENQQQEAKPTSPVAKVIAVLALLLLIAGGVLFYLHSLTYEDTDDAQVNGHLNSVAARVDGTVKGVYVENNQVVQAGQALVDLDTSDYKVSLDQSKAQLSQAQAQLTAANPNIPITRASNSADRASAGADVASAQAAIAAAQSDVATAQARLVQSQANNAKAQTDLSRYKQLLDRQEVAPQQYDQYLATAKAQQATVEADAAAVNSAQQIVAQRQATLLQQQARLQQTTANAPNQVAIRNADVRTQQAGVEAARATLERSQLNLTYTHIVAPVSGVVMQRSAEIGDRVSVGQQLMQIVQTDNEWIDANFKETQLKKIHVGQAVTIKVDALGESFEGVVEAMPAATGDRSSLFPAENATGNYVKVVQRLPVRIRFNTGQRDLDKLRPGMSAEPTVHLDR